MLPPQIRRRAARTCIAPAALLVPAAILALSACGSAEDGPALSVEPAAAVRGVGMNESPLLPNETSPWSSDALLPDAFGLARGGAGSVGLSFTEESGLRFAGDAFSVRRRLALGETHLREVLEEEGGGRLRWRRLASIPFTAGRVETWGLTLDGIPVRKMQIRSIEDGPGGSWASGMLPSFALAGERPVRVGGWAIDGETAAKHAAAALSFHPQRVRPVGRVFLLGAVPGTFVPAWVLGVSNSSGDPGRGPAWPLEVLVDGASGKVLRQAPLAFHVDGFGVLYEENSRASAAKGLENITLPGLKEDGTRLEHDAFRVVNCQKSEPSPTCPQVAVGGAGGDYSAIPFNSESYDELTAYHALSRAMDWHKRIMELYSAPDAGSRWGADKGTLGFTPNKRLTVFTRAKSLTQNGTYTLDNAQYLPRGQVGTGAPEIIVGTGWEPDQGGRTRAFQYLGRDADVSMHEFGHHVVFRGITEVEGQSLAMHEGYADYFTYAITGNNKLAESILASGLPLREGNLAGPVKNYFSVPAHRAGQYVSSVLWELRSAIATTDDPGRADKIIWDSIDLVPAAAQYYDMVKGVAQAAQVYALLRNQDPVALKEAIYKVFYERGFIKTPQGNGDLPEASAELAAVSGSGSGASGIDANTPSVVENKQTKKKGWCGVVAGTQGQAEGNFGWLVLLLPLALALRRPVRAIKIPARINDDARTPPRPE